MKNPLLIAGVVIALLGFVAFAIGGFSFNQQETKLQVGDLKVTANTERHVPIPPVVSIGAIVVGLLLAGFGAMRRK
jgi:hypothetical protein